MRHSIFTALYLTIFSITTACTTAHEQIIEDDFCKTGPSIKIEYKPEVPLQSDEGLVSGIITTPSNLLGQNLYIQSDKEVFRYCRASGFFIFKLKAGDYKLSISRADFDHPTASDPARFNVQPGLVLDLGSIFNTCDDWSTTEGNKTRFIETWKSQGPKAYKKTGFTYKKASQKQCLLVYTGAPLKAPSDQEEFKKKNNNLKWVSPSQAFYNSDFFK